MLELEDAVARILAAMPAPSAERIPLPQSYGRILAQSIAAGLELPIFDNSAMDGYAVRAEDISDARPEAPVRLRLVGKVAAGEVFGGALSAGTCVRLFTGSALPQGADAVVMQEDSRMVEDCADEVQILAAAKPWENVRLRGEDVREGKIVAEAGDRLEAGHLSLLAGIGIESVTVGRRPSVGLLASGSELKEPGNPLLPGQIYESNRVGLTPLIERSGAVPQMLPVVPDRLESTCQALEFALNDCDIIVTSGGVSVGALDFIKQAWTQIGGELEFWRVAIRPGRPFMFGRRAGKFLFGLPGNPVSAFVTLLLLVRPALLRWQGARVTDLPAHPAVLAEPLANTGERRHFFRIKVNEAGKVHSAGRQASHHLSSLAAANGLVDVPPKTSLPAGTVVSVRRWE